MLHQQAINARAMISDRQFMCDLIVKMIYDKVVLPSLPNCPSPAPNKNDSRLLVDETRMFNSQHYTFLSWERLTKAVNCGIMVIADQFATQDTVDQSSTNINNAITNLQPANGIVNKTTLNALIAQANALDSTHYTNDSWATMQGTLSSATSVATNVDSTQPAVDRAVFMLNLGINQLVRVPFPQPDPDPLPIAPAPTASFDVPVDLDFTVCLMDLGPSTTYDYEISTLDNFVSWSNVESATASVTGTLSITNDAIADGMFLHIRMSAIPEQTQAGEVQVLAITTVNIGVTA
jgi:hypothetical protein